MVSEGAQNKILAALVNAAFVEDDANNVDVAHEIRFEATRMAKRWGVSEISGLPGTWKRGKRIPDYD
jgi:hypothetical protein